jgi:hypothetical protein
MDCFWWGWTMGRGLFSRVKLPGGIRLLGRRGGGGGGGKLIRGLIDANYSTCAQYNKFFLEYLLIQYILL